MGRKASSNSNLFEYEKQSLDGLKALLSTQCGFNCSKTIDPWHPSLTQIQIGKDGHQFPAWVFKCCDGYKCVDKLIILAQRNKYFKSKRKDKYKLVYIGGGYIIDLKLNIQFQANDPQKQRQVIFINDVLENTENKRPQSSSRFDTDNFQPQAVQKNVIDKKNAIQQQKEIQYNLGFTFYEQNGDRNPSIKQIFDGLMMEVQNELSQSKLIETQKQFQVAVQNHTQAWKYIFNCLGLDFNNRKEIDDNEFYNPRSVITISILFLYSMETFLPYKLNLAERNQDVSKIQSLGPFARALGQISAFAQSSRKQNHRFEQNLYRGVKLPNELIKEYEDIKDNDGFLELKGFTSTSFEKNIALGFMRRELNDKVVPVLFEIKELNDKGYNYFYLDSDQYSLFPKEKEVLLSTGSEFKIIDISDQQNDDFKYKLVTISLIGI